MASKGPAGVSVTQFTSQFLCARIFACHGERIRVKKPHVAVANLVRIVEGFLKLANRKGFHAMSLRDLAEASGLSMGGLYSYFDSKDTLLLMVLGEVDTTMREVLKAVPPDIAADPVAHLHWVIDVHIRLTEIMHPWFVFIYMEAKSFPVSARRQAIDSETLAERTIADILARGAAAGTFELADPRLTAAIIKPMLQDWYVKRSKYRKRGTTVDAYTAAVSELVGRAIAPHRRNAAEVNLTPGTSECRDS